MIDILFVDDEPNILDGLKRMLRPLRREWQMSFATSGDEALQILAEKNFDVVISDMKMPGMEGAKLLEEIRNRFPQIVRIILSGYSEKEMIIRSIGTAHQYLSKPCEAEILKNVVTRACALRDLLADEKLRRTVSQLNSIPSLPTLYAELIAELNATEPDMRKIAAIVRQDIGMTVKILQIVNSSFFSLQRNISNADEAINYLGIDIVSSLALGIGVFSQFEENSQSSAALSEIWRESLAVANLAQKIAKAEKTEMAKVAFTVGLLHDIGTIILAVNLPEKFSASQKLRVAENITAVEAERRIFQTTHAEVGSYLLGLWGLPHQIVEAIEFHHFPHAFPTVSFTPLTAVYIADIFYHHKHDNLLTEPEKFFDVEYLEKLDLMEKVKIWHQEFVNNNYEDQKIKNL